MRLKDKVAIVVGAGQTPGDTNNAEGGECFTTQADVTSEKDCRAFVEAATKAYGLVDIVHNSVGIGSRLERAIQYSRECDYAGLDEHPMAIEGISRSRGIPKDELIRQREARIG